VNPFPLILSSPSGGGKTTIARMLLSRRDDLGYSISCTTREPRAGEIDGTDYHFLTRREFITRLERGDFAESAEVHGNLYGTLKSEIERVFGSGKHAIMAIDVQGARQFSAVFPESVLVFLLPPSLDTLLDRLARRKTEGPEETVRRLKAARDELDAVDFFQYVVVNDDLERAYAQVASIVDAETVRHRRLPLLDERVRQLADELDREVMQYTQAS
jgi:guanylate kinase